MSTREWFTGEGVSRYIRDTMLVLIGLDLLGMLVRLMATPTYSARLAWMFIWSVVYGIAYLFRRRA